MGRELATEKGTAGRWGEWASPLVRCVILRRPHSGTAQNGRRGAVTVKGVLPVPVLSPPLRVCERKVMLYVHLGKLPCSLRRNENGSNRYRSPSHHPTLPRAPSMTCSRKAVRWLSHIFRKHRKKKSPNVSHFSAFV